jgi:hypothetical protein
MSRIGRPKGAGSFVRISLLELNRVLKENASVIVNRRFAESLNLACQPFKVKPNGTNITDMVNKGINKPEEPVMAIGIQIENYNEE